MQRNMERNKKPPPSRESRKTTTPISIPAVTVPVRIIAQREFVQKHDLGSTNNSALWQLARSIVIGLRRFAKETKRTLRAVSIHTAHGRESVRCNWNDFKLAVSAILKKLYGLIPQFA